MTAFSLYSPNRWEWVVAYHAALRADAVVNPVNVMLTPEEVAFVLNDCGAAVIFTAGEKAEVMAALTRAVPTLRRVVSFDPAGGDVTLFEDLLTSSPAAQQIPRPAPGDLSTIGYTSGTTGHPKGAMQSHRAVFLNTAALFAVQARTERDVMLNALPLPHVYGIERVVAAHPAVAMVAVGSVPDQTLGELARAYVVLRPGATATQDQIIEHCRPHLAAYKRPRSIRFVPDLPKTSTGKVMRRQLKTLDR